MSKKADTISSKRQPMEARVPVTIRLPEDLIARIDQERKQRAVPISRNNWLFEAAIEKLEKNKSGGSHGAK